MVYWFQAVSQKLILTGLPLSRQYEILWLIPDFSRPRLSSTVSPRCSPRKFSKLGSSTWLKINFRQQNSPTFPWFLEFCRKFPDFLGKFPDFQMSLSNSLTFPGLPGQWQPCSEYLTKNLIECVLNNVCLLPLLRTAMIRNHMEKNWTYLKTLSNC